MITLLDKLEAEIERLTAELGDLPEAQADMLHTIKELRARLAEIEAQNLMARQIILEHGEGVAGASPVQPSQAWPKVSIELPQDDTRTVTVFWTEFRGDTLNVCIRVSD